MADPDRPEDLPPASSNFPVPVPFLESLGARLLEMGDGRALATLVPRPEHMNSWGVVHGGVLMTLLDFVMSMAGRSMRTDLRGGDGNAGGNLTVEMKTTFIRPGKETLFISGHCLQAGRTLNFCEGEIRDHTQQLVARASGTFKTWTKP